MESLALNAEKRTVSGKKVRFLRREGITPTHLIGHKVRSLALQCKTDELESVIKRAGTSRIVSLQIGKEKTPKKVFIKEIQRDAVKCSLQHVDFYQIKMKEKMKAEIPLVLMGEAPALKVKGHIISQLLTSVMVESLPDKLPPSINVDISPLENIHDTIYVKDITLDEDVAMLTDAESIIVKISEVAAAKVEEVPEEAEAEEAEEESAGGEASAESEEGKTE